MKSSSFAIGLLIGIVAEILVQTFLRAIFWDCMVAAAIVAVVAGAGALALYRREQKRTAYIAHEYD